MSYYISTEQGEYAYDNMAELIDSATSGELKVCNILKRKGNVYIVDNVGMWVKIGQYTTKRDRSGSIRAVNFSPDSLYWERRNAEEYLQEEAGE